MGGFCCLCGVGEEEVHICSSLQQLPLALTPKMTGNGMLVSNRSERGVHLLRINHSTLISNLRHRKLIEPWFNYKI